MRKMYYVLILVLVAVSAGILVETFMRHLNVEPLSEVEGPDYTKYLTDPELFPKGGKVTVIELPYSAGDCWSIHTIMNETEFKQYISLIYLDGMLVTYDEYRFNVNWGLYQFYVLHNFTVEDYGTKAWNLTVIDVNGNEKNMLKTA